MTQINYNQEQHSLDWYRSRLGNFTGSRIGALMKSGKSKSELFGQTAKSYIYQIAGERNISPEIRDNDELFQVYLDVTSVSSKAMRWGSEQEENAKRLYEDITQREIKPTGLCTYQDVPHFASSPDGLVQEDGVLGCVEVKCPQLPAFTQYVSEITDNETLYKTNPDYFYQCQAHMACTGAMFCDFIVYSPFVETPIHIVRITRDDTIIKNMVERVKEANKMIDEIHSQIQNRA
ncbi:MAG: YqaJ viral recombinase family protein [Oscillospiraceae bacterium]|nr:YqaJ viral recombinase family protein [Oscillospiraceae bacterium]